ncbi:response regulator [Nostoc sp. PA-18-2419]|uniref:response regulator n=1 Tax=Nostoc sp. PA-18-2419 TaxID=2575443 RepID=UPI00110831F2|nr:response regulator [Nostoc sp. PA-18-2419]
MQGNLSEIDICSILQLIELGQRTGQLWVEAHSYRNNKPSGTIVSEYTLKQQSWFVFFLNGQIIYCQQGESSLSRISDYLRHYRVEMQLADKQIASLSSTDAPEYAYLWALLEQNIINPKIAASIIYNLVHETLFDLLSLHQGNFIFRQGAALAPQLHTLEITYFVIKITKELQEWKQLYPHIQSPEQLPVLSNKLQIESSLPAATVNKLQHWADGKTSLRQLARYLNRDILTVAKAIYPYVQQSWLQLVYSTTNKPDTHTDNWELKRKSRGQIVCIDDAIAIGETVNSILQAQGYEAIVLTNPLEALSLIFQLKPDLILCDIAMSQLEGYEVCAMLRHSTAFRFTPIIMLTGKDGFIDRVKASMVGATDYLTKPFTDTELLILVGKYINNQ